MQHILIKEFVNWASDWVSGLLPPLFPFQTLIAFVYYFISFTESAYSMNFLVIPSISLQFCNHKSILISHLRTRKP